MENNKQDNIEKRNFGDKAKQFKDEVEIDLIEVFRVFLSFWKLILIIVVIGVILGGAYQKVCIGHEYKADTSIFIANTDSVITISDMQLSSELTVDYQKILTSRATLKRVIEDLNLKMNYRQLASIVTISTEESSHVLTISAITSSPKLSQNIANSMMNVGIDRIQNVVTGSEATVVDSASSDAVEEVTPSIIKYAGIGGLLGAFIICIIILLMYIFDSTIKGEDEVVNWLNLPVLAGIPFYGKEKNMVREKLNYYEKESFNTLCGNISLSGFNTKVVAVTSAAPDEGKSSLAFKMAETLTDFKKSVIYVDCDMRNSNFCNLYGIDKSKTKGLSEFLSGSTSINDILIHDDDNDKLFIICSGKNPPTPSALLSGSRFKGLVEVLRDTFDYIILDTPPVNAVIDGVFVAKESDGTILIVESAVTERKPAERAISELVTSDCEILGAVINKIGQKKVRYGYGGYGYGYGKKYGYGRKYGYGKKYGYGYGGKYGYGYAYGSVAEPQGEKPVIDKEKAKKAARDESNTEENKKS